MAYFVLFCACSASISFANCYLFTTYYFLKSTDDLVCFQRDMLEPVRGCSGEGTASIDYCTRAIGAQATAVATYNFGVVNSGLQLETVTTTVIVQSQSGGVNNNIVVQNVDSLPLGQCQGVSGCCVYLLQLHTAYFFHRCSIS